MAFQSTAFQNDAFYVESSSSFTLFVNSVLHSHFTDLLTLVAHRVANPYYYYAQQS